MTYKTKRDLTPVEKIYWYLRYFVETDKGGLAKEKAKLRSLCDALGVAMTSGKEFPASDHLKLLKTTLNNNVLKKVKTTTAKYTKLTSLCDELSPLLESTDDYRALIFCLDKLLIPSNKALEDVPTTQATEIAQEYASNVLDTQGTKGLANILKEWDSITLDICLNRERDLSSNLFSTIRSVLDQKEPFFNKDVPGEPDNFDIILSSVIQEFERRLGQKRKQRSGQDLEDATTYIFKKFGIKGSNGPEHFNAAIEVDNWVKDNKKWFIGFSLKRTLRERWKQTVVDTDTLTSFKIRHIIHLICNDGDLTDNKIAEMGSKRHLFFVPDSSEVLTRTKKDNVLKEFVYPMSELINFLKLHCD